MRVGIIQSSFIPWRGYFDFIASVDAFVFYDDIQYTRRDWRNRNRIKTPKGWEWLSVPVHFSRTIGQTILETRIDTGQDWPAHHLGRWGSHYRTAPHLEAVRDIYEKVLSEQPETISALNIGFIKAICRYLDITTPLVLSTELGATGCKTDRLIGMLTRLGADRYLSGPAADAYLDKTAFSRAGIQLEYKSYDYPPYPQLWGPFEAQVSILDLIANCGPAARDFLRSRREDEVIVRIGNTDSAR